MGRDLWWGRTFAGPRLAAAVVDRLTFRAQIVAAINGALASRALAPERPDDLERIKAAIAR